MMVLCLIIGSEEKLEENAARNVSAVSEDENGGLKVFGFLTIITHHGVQTRSLATERRRKWILAISQVDMTEMKLADDRA